MPVLSTRLGVDGNAVTSETERVSRGLEPARARARTTFLFVCIPRVAVRDIIGTTRVYNGCHYSRTMGQAARRMFNWKIACLPVFLIRDSSLNPIGEASHCDVFESSIAANNEFLSRKKYNKYISLIVISLLLKP